MTDTPNPNFTDDMSFASEPVSPYDPQDSSRRRAMILLGVTAAGLLALAWLVFSLYEGGTRVRGEVPYVSADGEDFKTVPDDPGGAQVPGQDREVLNAGLGETVVTERPRVEQPLDPIPETMQVEVEPVTPQVRDNPIVQQPVRVPPPKPVVANPTPTPSRPAPSQTATMRPDPGAGAPKPGAVQGGSSDWVVQAGAFRSDAEANALWNTVSGKFSQHIPSSAYADIERADLGERGIYYRMRVAGLADKRAAMLLCDAFKAGNQACFVKRR